MFLLLPCLFISFFFFILFGNSHGIIHSMLRYCVTFTIPKKEEEVRRGIHIHFTQWSVKMGKCNAIDQIVTRK